MNVGWIYPHRERCGIARYSLDYIEALSGLLNVVDIDPQWLVTDRKRFTKAIDRCDLVHLQYDTSSFVFRNRDFYGAVVRAIKPPLIVTLHEVYEEAPGVFPRSRLSGPFPLLQLKRALWDLRHPLQRAFERHLRTSFGARAIVVHHRFHVDILNRAGIAAPLMRILPNPVKPTSPPRRFLFPDLPRVNIAAAGFINPAYDYDLLFATLERMRRPWTFTWIGGMRTGDQQTLLDRLRTRILRNGWNDRFTITGWVDDNELTARLAAADCVLALFAARSSSSSLPRALGAFKPVIAADLPLVREISARGGPSGEFSGDPDTAPPLLVTPRDADAVVETIERLLTDTQLRQCLFRGLSRYTEETSFEQSAVKLLTLYRGLLFS